MTKFGVSAMMTDLGVQPVELARRVEDAGFESLWFGEHTHSPTPERDPARDPIGFDQLYDPYASMAAAAAVTNSLNIGVAVALVPLYHPIHLAKMVATIDHISGGRCYFGVGGGHRVQEVEDFGIPFADRWKVTREYIRAIRAIWAGDVAEFEGQFVKFGPMRCWPKPARPKGPPVLEGSVSQFTAKRIAEYADGWLAVDTMPAENAAGIFAQIREEMEKDGRDPNELEHTMIMRIPVDAKDARARIDFMIKAGFHRICFLMNRGETGKQIHQLRWFKQLSDSYSS
jgi:probable F420-dependent oxidoreductase